jgi:polar amino acid transport system ATP-binding protein
LNRDVTRFGLAEKRADYPDRPDGGQIVEQAPPARLFSEPSDERTRRFLRRIVDAGRL